MVIGEFCRQSRGEQMRRYIYQLLSILLAARSPEKLKTDDLKKYGLDQPQLNLKAVF